MIQAVILAGGFGTRMLPLTERVPKPLLPVLGRPFLDYQIELVRANGMREVLLLVSHLGPQIEEHLGDGARHGVSIKYSYEPSPRGTGGALKYAESMLADEFLLLNGDTLLDIEYHEMVCEFRERGTLAMVAAYRNRTAHVPSNLALDDRNLVTGYQKNLPTGEHVDAGVTAVRKAVLPLLPHDERCSFEQHVFPKLIAMGEMAAWPTDELFFDMGTPDGMQRLEAHLRTRHCAVR